ncbi:hypothetical protein [Desulfitobacterium hafniense]|uniref:hypothetical protein n=1 Tax=Desulfitobacterium hafniense TaxID=49338 RepID=UPI00035CAA29|nr:hypothetical protein [Desulfitobacterium hafniense]
MIGAKVAGEEQGGVLLRKTMPDEKDAKEKTSLTAGSIPPFAFYPVVLAGNPADCRRYDYLNYMKLSGRKI